jgi:hypothetical protein
MDLNNMNFQQQLYAENCREQLDALHTQQPTEALAAEPKGSTQLSPKPATGHDSIDL